MPNHYLIDAPTLLNRRDDPSLRIFDCRFALADPSQGRRWYSEGHVPGAVFADLDEHLASPIGPTTGRHPLPDADKVIELMRRSGVDARTEVIACDDVGGGFAVRLWWLLRWLGHGSVKLLDGGLPAWRAAGGTMTRAVPSYAPSDFAGSPNHALWVSTEEIEDRLTHGEVQIVDARAAERFRGEVEPIDPVAGHIPGAINLPLTENLDSNGCFLSPGQLRKRFTNALGDTPPERVAHSCGSGVNACHNLFAMELAGLTGSLLYAGSWSEWIRSQERSVAIGD